MVLDQETLEGIVIFFARPDVCITVFATLFVLLITYWYMMSDQAKIEQSSTKSDIDSKNSKNENEKEDKQRKDSLEEEEGQNNEELEKMLLDSQDFEMINKCEELDTKDPSSVKHYVQEIRTMSYKGKNLTAAEKEQEEEVKHQQLAQIFALMNQQKEKFGETTFDDLKEQMSMYNQ